MSGARERPILFSGEMIRAILDGRKTQTRGLEHSIERIIPEPLLSPLRTRGRISITIRVAG